MFQYKNRWAKKVELVGDFTGWKPEPMYIDEAHVWIAVKDLAPGEYHYNFLINGKKEIRDPWNRALDPSRRSRGSSTFVVEERYP
jgi:1,4-alpha-glucan branching enzyme